MLACRAGKRAYDYRPWRRREQAVQALASLVNRGFDE